MYIVYLEPNKDLYVSHFPFLMSGILGWRSGLRLQTLKRLSYANFEFSYDGLGSHEIPILRERLLFSNNHEFLDEVTRSKII